MTVLLAGLVLFLGVHSARIVADAARARFIAQRGEAVWKGLYTLVSAVGLALIVWGFGLARQQPIVLWTPPEWTRLPASLLMLVSFVLLSAAYVPRNAIKARLHHPMMLGTVTWALGHLLVNHTLAGVFLFGGFLVWAVFGFRAARKRDRAAPAMRPAGALSTTIVAVIIGALAWAVFGFWAHEMLIGVRPFG
jgi:uncharacterized membrane protein